MWGALLEALAVSALSATCAIPAFARKRERAFTVMIPSVPQRLAERLRIPPKPAFAGFGGKVTKSEETDFVAGMGPEGEDAASESQTATWLTEADKKPFLDGQNSWRGCCADCSIISTPFLAYAFGRKALGS